MEGTSPQPTASGGEDDSGCHDEAESFISQQILPFLPPSLSCCLLHAGTLRNILASSNHRGDLRAPPAAAPSPQGQHPREQSPGRIQAQGIQPGWERGNRRVRLCPAPAEKIPSRSYHNPGSGRPQAQRLSGDLPPPPARARGSLSTNKSQPWDQGGVPMLGGVVCHAVRRDQGRVTAPRGITGMSPALVAAAESCQAPAPLLPPPRNAATARAKILPRQLPTGTHGIWGIHRGQGQEVPPAVVSG